MHYHCPAVLGDGEQPWADPLLGTGLGFVAGQSPNGLTAEGAEGAAPVLACDLKVVSLAGSLSFPSLE